MMSWVPRDESHHSLHFRCLIPYRETEITLVCVNFQNFLCAYVYLSSLHCPLLWTANPWTRLSCVCFFFFSQQLVLVFMFTLKWNFMFTLKWKKNLLYFSAPKHPPGICLVPALSLSPSRCSGPGPVRTRVHRGAALGCWKPSCRRTHNNIFQPGKGRGGTDPELSTVLL